MIWAVLYPLSLVCWTLGTQHLGPLGFLPAVLCWAGVVIAGVGVASYVRRAQQ